MNRALLFDYDGLIVDTETVLAQVLVEILAEDGHTFEVADFGHLLGSTGPESDLEWERFLTPILGTYDGELLEGRIGKIARTRIDALAPLPGTVELASSARAAGWRTGIATGNTRERVTERLTALGVADAFEEIVTTTDVGRGKPAPDIYIELARRLGVSPEHCIALEDSAKGCRAALDAGMAVVCCPCAATASCEFPNGVTRVGSLAELSLNEVATLASAPLRR